MKTLTLKPKLQTPYPLATILYASLTKRELLAMAKQYGAICKAYKYDTAANIARKIVEKQNLTITIKHK